MYLCYVLFVQCANESLYYPDVEFFELSMAWKTNWFLLLSNCLKRILMSLAIMQHSLLMDVLELLHTFVDSTRALLSSRRRLFSPFCLNSWKGLKNIKHLMVIKVAHMHTAFVLALNAFPFFVFFFYLSWNRKKKPQNKTTARWSEWLYCETKYGKHAHKINRKYRSLFHSLFINRIILIRYRWSFRAFVVRHAYIYGCITLDIFIFSYNLQFET